MQETNESLGTYLKRARESRSVSIEQVAYATRISLKMLRALEEDEHVSLPAPTFVRGYLQAYAKYVRIDTQDLLLRYQHHLATAPDAKRNAIRSHYLYVRERYQEKRRLVLVIVLFATMLSVAGAYFFLKAQREKHKRLAHTAEQIQKSEEKAAPPPLLTLPAEPAANKDAKEPTKDTKPAAQPTPPSPPPVAEKAPEPKAPEKPVAAPAPEVKPAPVPAPSPAPAPAPEAKPAPAPAPTPAPAAAPASTPAPAAKADEGTKQYSLLLKATDDVWFRYQTDEDEIKDLTLRSGKAMLLKANKVIKIFSGNLGALKAKLNGKELDALASDKRSKSVILPESEAPNYKLPLFPQFQTKPAKKAVAPEAGSESQEPNSASPAPAPTPATPEDAAR